MNVAKALIEKYDVGDEVAVKVAYKVNNLPGQYGYREISGNDCDNLLGRLMMDKNYSLINREITSAQTMFRFSNDVSGAFADLEITVVPI